MLAGPRGVAGTMAIIDVRQISSHRFRSYRRRAAIEKKEFDMRKMRAEIQELRSKSMEVVKEIYVEVEKIVEVPVFTEADVEAAFAKGAEKAMAGMSDFKKTVMDKYRDTVEEYEQKLKEAADNELKMKDLKGMLRKLMVENADLKKSIEMREKVKENEGSCGKRRPPT